MRKALIIGIDEYPDFPLNGCENDAAFMSNILETNGDGSPNFSIKLISSDSLKVTSELMSTSIEELFKGDAETALFYFAGHGIIDSSTNAGYLVSQNGKKGSWGISVSELVGKANKAYPRINSTVIILDCCNSGFTGELVGLNNELISVIGTGVTILTACHREGTAAESGDNGLFTKLLRECLSGSSADIMGRITPASVYAHIDQALGPWAQRPIYKANVQNFITLRNISPKISPDILRRLPTYFKNATDQFKLDPSFEPDRNNIPEEYKELPVNEDNVRIFNELQTCNRHGLVIPVNAEHMYFAAINSTACKLTALGAHFRKLAEMGRI